MPFVDLNKFSQTIKRMPEVAVLRGETARIAKLAIDEAIKEDERKYWEEKKKRIIGEEQK